MKSKIKVYQSHKVDGYVRCVVMCFSHGFQFPCKIRENEPRTFLEIFSVLQNVFGT